MDIKIEDMGFIQKPLDPHFNEMIVDNMAKQGYLVYGLIRKCPS